MLKVIASCCSIQNNGIKFSVIAEMTLIELQPN